MFTKTAIYALFGIGLALLAAGRQQSLSDFVGAVVLLCGACFTPLLMLRLVHFAAETQVAGEMMGTLRGGVQPVLEPACPAAAPGGTRWPATQPKAGPPATSHGQHAALRPAGPATLRADRQRCSTERAQARCGRWQPVAGQPAGAARCGGSGPR